MKINLVTLFPEFFLSPLSSALMHKAVDSRLVEFCFYNPREFTDDKRQTVDDRPYGGGPGMVMLLEPLVRLLNTINANHAKQSTAATASTSLQNSPSPAAPACACGKNTSASAAPATSILPQGPRILYMSPKGRPFNQKLARELAAEKEITILCGRYEGIDARLNDIFPIEEVSMGDFVLNGGETAALAVCEATCRLIPGFMGHEDSGLEESFSAGLLEYPHYTRPDVYSNLAVPDVLKSGDHAKINRWRRNEALLTTLKMRPEILQSAALSKEDMAVVKAQPRFLPGKNLYIALVHHPVLSKEGKSISVAVTNLDIHDISRASRSYGAGGFFIVTPLKDQQLIVNEVLTHWVSGPGSKSNPDRKEALSKTTVTSSVEEAIKMIEAKHGVEPLIWSTSAQMEGSISFEQALNHLHERPALLLLGTSHGLAPEITEKCHASLPPLRWAAPYNHLSVRCAAALLLDRILGEWG
ncbi:tRNA (guanosine(37)-N1)-methyltransferase TrmD [Desulfovibrio sp. OttesenSCG-928-F07]|nr:tRNA (guanosine(37)-N1)-methyltransferase TrmD [Desulfovibrio sp. OttesenSCG-928-F07]